MTEVSSGVRPRIADAGGQVFTLDFWRELAEEIKDASKGVSAEAELDCYHCGAHNRKKVVVQIRDYAKILESAMKFVEQAEGKPGTASTEDAGMVLVVERNWPAGAA